MFSFSENRFISMCLKKGLGLMKRLTIVRMYGALIWPQVLLLSACTARMGMPESGTTPGSNTNSTVAGIRKLSPIPQSAYYADYNLTGTIKPTNTFVNVSRQPDNCRKDGYDIRSLYFGPRFPWIFDLENPEQVFPVNPNGPEFTAKEMDPNLQARSLEEILKLIHEPYTPEPIVDWRLTTPLDSATLIETPFPGPGLLEPALEGAYPGP